MYNQYVTDWGEVRISDDEHATLSLAYAAERELRGSPFLDQPHAKRLMAKAEAIRTACEKFARYRFNG